jgi:hypothetical protein
MYVRLCETMGIGPTWIDASHLAPRVAITEYNIMLSSVAKWSDSKWPEDVLNVFDNFSVRLDVIEWLFL